MCSRHGGLATPVSALTGNEVLKPRSECRVSVTGSAGVDGPAIVGAVAWVSGAGVAVAVWLAEACVFRGRAAVSSGFMCAPCAAAVAAEPAMPCSRTAVQTPATPRTRALAISKPPRAAATAQPTAKSPSAASMVASTRARFRVDLRPRTGPRVRPDTRALRDAYTHGG